MHWCSMLQTHGIKYDKKKRRCIPNGDAVGPVHSAAAANAALGGEGSDEPAKDGFSNINLLNPAPVLECPNQHLLMHLMEEAHYLQRRRIKLLLSAT